MRIYNKYIKFKNLNVKFNRIFHFKNKDVLMSSMIYNFYLYKKKISRFRNNSYKNIYNIIYKYITIYI